MATPMEKIKQTGKTIIFEKYNESDPETSRDLITLLTKSKNPLSTPRLLEVFNEKLAVKSFDEFIEKFSPTIYERIVLEIDSLGNKSYKFDYSLERPENKDDAVGLSLTDHSFYKMICQIMDRKIFSGDDNLSFNYDEIKDALTPKRALEEAKQIRKNLQSNMIDYLKLEAKGVPSDDMDRLADDIVDCRNKIVDKYQGKTPLALLPLAIADVQSKLNLLDFPKDEGIASDSIVTSLPCDIQFDDNGDIEPVKYEISTNAEINIDNKNAIEDKISQRKQLLIDTIKNDFNDYAPPALKNGNFVSNMILDSFVGVNNGELVELNKSELEKKENLYLDVYKSSLESFVKAVISVVEKIIGVRSFFQHATVNGKLASDVCIYISNCRVDEILNNQVAKERFSDFIKDISNQNSTNRIWFGVIPAISFGEEQFQKKVSGPFGSLNRDNVNNQNEAKKDFVSLSSAKEMLSILKDAKVMTFINFKGSEKTGFSELNSDIVREYKDSLSSINSEYAVFSYPNFTILPKEKDTVDVSSSENHRYFRISGVYLDSAYVAAGLTVGTQNYKYLESIGLEVNPEYPCVRFDFEEKSNQGKILTKTNRERSTDISPDTQKEIANFGFCFACSEKYDSNDNPIINTYVLNSRSLLKDNGSYKSIYKTLTNRFVLQYVLLSNINPDETDLEKFKREEVEIWKNDYKVSKSKNWANKILMEGENITYDSDSEKLVVNYKDGPEPILGLGIENS